MFTGYITNPIAFVLVLILALVLLALEVMVPSFGILGISGGYFLIESIISIKNFDNPVLYILISLVVSAIIIGIMIKYFFKNMDRNRLVLNTNLEASKGNGRNLDLKEFIGKEAIVNKTLRPSGEVEIEGKIYEAVSFGNYIAKDEKVIVEKVEGKTIYVK